jgi:hypothetical protein
VALGPDGRVAIPSDRVAPSIKAIETSDRRDSSAIRSPVLMIVPERYELAPKGSDEALRTEILAELQTFLASPGPVPMPRGTR